MRIGPTVAAQHSPSRRVHAVRLHAFAGAFAFLLTIGAVEAAADERCGDAADDALFTARSWHQLNEWFESYAECDDGYFAEHVSTLVGEWLSATPAQLESLARMVAASPSFEDHVARYIDVTLSEETTKRIRHNVEHECPSEAARVCARLRRALDELDREVARVRRTKD